MFGSAKVKFLYGSWHHVGTMDTSELTLPAVGINDEILPKGTWVDQKDGNEFVMRLASGHAKGFLTQDVSADGQTDLQSFKDRTIGKKDLPIKKGQHVSVRVPDAGAEIEFEGLGEAVPGNLVCTSGTGNIASGAARNTELSFHNGCIRIAQTNDIVQALLQDAALTPEVVGNRRIRIRMVAGYVMA